jgi:hypothetical protein
LNVGGSLGVANSTVEPIEHQNVLDGRSVLNEDIGNENLDAFVEV